MQEFCGTEMGGLNEKQILCMDRKGIIVFIAVVLRDDRLCDSKRQNGCSVHQDGKIRGGRMKSVFISSTFKDMQAERDMLHERIFPRLRKVIGEYGEDIQELDLRWGVDTAEMSEEESGHLVLRVCIDAIDRCKPYIIVLLGERYGWIPELQLVESLRDERVSALYEEQMSITNLEIRYGALSEEETLRKCVFCFRDPKLIREIDEAHRPVYDAESSMHRERLSALKDQIRAKEEAVILDYEAGWDAEAGRVCGLETFGEALYEQLVQMIKRDFAGLEIKDPKEKLSLQMERMKEQYLSSYVVRYREELMMLSKIRNYDHMKKSIPELSEKYLERVILKGAAGSGKSALMASVENRLKKHGLETILYFSGNSGCQSLDVLKDYIIYRLEEICGLAHEESDSRDERLRFLGEQAVGKRIYCFIDAVDQLFGREAGVRLDVLDLCPGLYYVLSSLSDFPVEESVKTYVWPFMTCRIEDFTVEERRNMIRMAAAKRGKKLDDMITEMTVKESGAGNPLYLSMLLQRYFMMDQREFEAAEALAPGMEGLHLYMEKLLLEMPDEVKPMVEYLFLVTGGRFGIARFREILQLLALSRSGLTEQELEGILSAGGMHFLQVEFQQLVSYLYDAFVCREDGKWTFAHRLFEEAVLGGMTQEEEKAAWDLLIGYSLRDAEFLEREGFYYILGQDHPAGLQVIEQSEQWKTKFAVRDFIGKRVVQEKESHSYFLDLTGRARSDTLDKFWLSFNTNSYPAEFGGFLFSLWKEILKKDGVSDEVKYRCAFSLSMYVRKQGEREEGYRLLAQAEEICDDSLEPEKSTKLSDLYVMRALWRSQDSMGEEWEKVKEECEWALKRLEPFLALENVEERKEVLKQDFQNKVDYAELCATYTGDFMEGMLEECLERIEGFEEAASDDDFERWKVDLCTVLTRAYQSGKHIDMEKSLACGERAMELSERLLVRDSCLKNMNLRLSVIENYVYCFKKGFRYPYLEEYLCLIRDIFARYPSDYWKRELAYAECHFALAVDNAVQNRSKVFPEDLRKRAEKSWKEGFRLFEELLKTDHAQKVFGRYELFLNEKAAFDEERGYHRQALASAGRGREMLEAALLTESGYYQKERELRDLDLIMASALCDLCRPKEALPYAEESVEMALKRQEQTGRVFEQTAKARLVYARTLYYLRKDGEALEACEAAKKAYAALAEGLQSGKALKACAELNYIRGRIFLEQGRLSEMAECIQDFEAFCRDQTNSWEYGQDLLLQADYLAAQGEREKAEEAFEQALAFWTSRSKLEKKWLTERKEYSVYERDGSIYRTISRAESGHYRQAVYYRLYSLYKKTGLTGTWDGRLKTVLAYIEDTPVETFYAEWIWLPANIPAFAGLTAMVPEEVKEKWMPVELKGREKPVINLDRQVEEIASRGEAEPSLCNLLVKEIIGLYRQVKESYSDYLTLLSRSRKLSAQFQVDVEEALEKAGFSQEQRRLFGDRQRQALSVWYPLLKLCGIAYRCRANLTENALKNLYSLSQNCFLYAGGYKELGQKRGERQSWDVSSLSDDILELLLKAFDDERKHCSVTQAGRDARNVCVLELYRRTGERAYIDRRLRELSDLEEYAKHRVGIEMGEFATGVGEFLRDALKQGGLQLVGGIFSFLKEHSALKEKMYMYVLEELQRGFREVQAGCSDENISLREQVEDFWQAGYRRKWEEMIKQISS